MQKGKEKVQNCQAWREESAAMHQKEILQKDQIVRHKDVVEKILQEALVAALQEEMAHQIQKEMVEIQKQWLLQRQQSKNPQ